MPRKICEIAEEIVKDWKKPYFGAVPYLNAMRGLSSPRDEYYAEDGRAIVLYFLGNAKSWRGETARRIKTELKSILEESK